MSNDLDKNKSKEIPKSKSELIDEKLMGLEIKDNDNDYGIICRIVQVNNDFKVYTTLGHSFNAGLILNLLALANLHEKAAQKAQDNDDPNVEYLAPAFIENARLSNKIMSRPKPMAHSKELRSNGSVNNTAKVSKDEEIVITSHTSKRQSFVEDISYNATKNRTGLTIDEICEREGISVYEYFESRKESNNG
jgi:hypothetical protein